jgi:hypothetical protein
MPIGQPTLDHARIQVACAAGCHLLDGKTEAGQASGVVVSPNVAIQHGTRIAEKPRMVKQLVPACGASCGAPSSRCRARGSMIDLTSVKSELPVISRGTSHHT